MHGAQLKAKQSGKHLYYLLQWTEKTRHNGADFEGFWLYSTSNLQSNWHAKFNIHVRQISDMASASADKVKRKNVGFCGTDGGDWCVVVAYHFPIMQNSLAALISQLVLKLTDAFSSQTLTG